MYPPTPPNLRYWAVIVFAKEIVETGLQIINVAGYAATGYTSSSLFLYFSMIALNAAVWWMLTLPRTIRVVRGILVLNALISAFYGLFPTIYFFIDGVGGILKKGNDDVKGVSIVTRNNMVLGAAREALFGGGSFGEVARKVIFRLFPLFLSISAIEDLTGLDFYLKGADTNKLSHVTTDAMKRWIRLQRRVNSIITSDSSTTPTTPTHTHMILTFARAASRMSRDLAKSHRYLGLAKWKVVPAIVFVLALVIAMCGRLASLNESCQYSHGSSNSSGGQSQQHWVKRWCLYQAYPLLTELPGSPSECACAVLWVRGDPINVKIKTTSLSKRGPCNQGALTQLHDDMVREDRYIATYLQTLIHFCASQNGTETENILATNKLGSVTSINLFDPGGASKIADGGVKIQLRVLPQKLLTFHAQNIPFANPSATTFEQRRVVDFVRPSDVRNLLLLSMNNVGWGNIPAGALLPLTGLVELNVKNNRLTQLPDLATYTALGYLYASGNRLSSWPRSLERLTNLAGLEMQRNQLTNIPALVDRLPDLKYLDVSYNAITSLESLAATAAVGGEAAVQSGRNETMLLLGRNPVCTNGGTSSRLDAKWFVSCQSRCSSMCPSIAWEPASATDSRGDGACHAGCNTTACSYDGGDCVK